MNVIREFMNGRTVIVIPLTEIERITEQIVILHHGRLLALGNLHAIREKMDNIPHRIDIGCESPKELAKSVIDIDSVHGILFQNPEKLTVQTQNLGDFHSHLPKTIIEEGIKSIHRQQMTTYRHLAT